MRLACSDPPQGRCHWTLQLLADELVVLGLVDTLSTETVRQALKKTTSAPGSSKRGASRRTPTPTSSGAWKTSSRRTIALRPAVSRGLFRRSLQATVRGGAAVPTAQARQPATDGLRVRTARASCHQLMMCEPLRGWRHVKVTARRTRQDYARVCASTGGSTIIRRRRKFVWCRTI